MNRYNNLLHTKILLNGITYYYQIFDYSIFYLSDGTILQDKKINEILSKKINYITKLTNLLFLVDKKIQDNKILILKEKFPINSKFYYGKSLYVVDDIYCNQFISSEHNPDYHLDKNYSISPKGHDTYLFSIPITECISQKDLRLQKLSRII